LFGWKRAHARRAAARRCAVLWLAVAAPLLWAYDEGVVAVIGDREVSRDELLTAADAALEEREMEFLRCQAQATRDRHEVLEASLRQLVQRHLLDLEAARVGATAAAVEADVEAAAVPVRDQDIETFYQRNRARIGRPLAEVAGQIRAFLERQAVVRAREELFAVLEARFAAEYRLAPLRFEVAADGFASRGEPDAAVTIVEFSDFECPFCVRVQATLERLLEQYAGSVRLVYRHFPLTSIHPNAYKAAEASLCAGEQDRFWEYHDLLFAEQQAMSVPDLKDKARRIGLAGAEFDGCLDSGRHTAAVRTDLFTGSALGVSGTPAFFVNGRFLSGAVPFEHFAELIDDEMARVQGTADAAPGTGGAT
jgi:protein-disulfide isomerase